ncbi:MAG: sugar nucleotide-binding protein, partial [archaeon]
MKIFLSGATSYLGSKFISLCKDKYEIFGFSRHDPEHAVDFLDLDTLSKAFNEFNPDVIIHLGAIVDQDAEKVRGPNIEGTRNLVALAKSKNIPFVFMSSESVYGGKAETGDYKEVDQYQPRSVYGETKVESEKLVKESGLSYLILRGHRFVGINLAYNKPKQFPDTLKALANSEVVHLDSKKLFKPTLINHVVAVIETYLTRDLGQQIILNVGTEKAVT